MKKIPLFSLDFYRYVLYRNDSWKVEIFLLINEVLGGERVDSRHDGERQLISLVAKAW